MTDQSFADRLNRIQAKAPTPEPAPEPGAIAGADMIGSMFQRTPRAEPDLYGDEPTLTFSQRYTRAIFRNFALGFVWMAATGFAGVNYPALRSWLENAPAMAPHLMTYLTLYGIAMTVSVGSFAYLAHQATEDFYRAAKGSFSLLIGGLVGGLVGMGPVAFAELAKRVAEALN